MLRPGRSGPSRGGDRPVGGEGEGGQCVGAGLGHHQVAGGVEGDTEGNRSGLGVHHRMSVRQPAEGPTPNTSMSLPLALVVTISWDPLGEKATCPGVLVNWGVAVGFRPSGRVDPGIGNSRPARRSSPGRSRRSRH